MPKSIAKPWEPKTVEDRILAEYWDELGGQLWVEVGIVLATGPYSWPQPSKTRYIDGVIVPDAPPGVLVWRRKRHGDLLEAVRRREAYLVEAKKALGRYGIGQAIVARDAFGLDYPGHGPLTSVVAVHQTDAAMTSLASRHDVQVWVADRHSRGPVPPDPQA